MVIRTSSDLGALIRDRRIKLGLDQLSLAKKAGTSRKWVIEMEAGKPRAEIGLILRTLKALDVALRAGDSETHVPSVGVKAQPESIDIDNIIDSLQRRR